MLLTFDRLPIFHKRGFFGSLGPSRVQHIIWRHVPPYWIFRHVGFDQKPLKGLSCHKLCLIFSKRCPDNLQTATHECIQQLLEIQKRLAVTTNQTWRLSHQTGSTPISQQDYGRFSIPSTQTKYSSTWKYGLGKSVLEVQTSEDVSPHFIMTILNMDFNFLSASRPPPLSPWKISNKIWMFWESWGITTYTLTCLFYFQYISLTRYLP